MNLSIFGLGYVGCVMAGCLAARGHRVIGVDINADKLAAVAEGRLPLVEPNLAPLIARAVADGLLTTTMDASYAVANSDMSLICVGTPSRSDGRLDLTHLEDVSRHIGDALRKVTSFHSVVMRSTLMPTTTEDKIIPLLEQESGRRAGVDFGVGVNPEFLREGTGVEDYNAPPLTVIGADDARTAAAVESLYAHLDAPVMRCGLRQAEMIKYAANAWHATKITFANEIGALCKAMAIDSHAVMEALCRDTKLNIAPAYLRPGFAFGGSCLPKDLRALTALARHKEIAVPLLSAILPSNTARIDHALRLIQATGQRKIGLIGISFKPATDDMRESPLVTLAQHLIQDGYRVRVYDPNVQPDRLIGANRDLINARLPDLAAMMVSNLEALILDADVIVIGHPLSAYDALVPLLREDQHVIDLVRGNALQHHHAHYHGIAW